MPYLKFDLDALNRAPAVARAAGVSEDTIIAGLARLWAWCFREKVDVVSETHLRGHFGTEVSGALVAFGFLAVGEEHRTFRVRGAEDYLRVAESRSKGGRLAAGNLKKGTAKQTAEKGPQPGQSPRLTPGSLPAPAGDKPGNVPGSLPALPPNTKHLAPREEALAPPPAARTPRESDDLCADFESIVGTPYAWQGAKDGAALARLRKQFSLEEVRARWRLGLRAKGWLSVRTVAQLAGKWNDLADGGGGNARSPVAAETIDWTTAAIGEVPL